MNGRWPRPESQQISPSALAKLRDRIAQIIAQVSGVSVAAMRGGCRVASVVEARGLLMWLLRETTDASLPSIGWALGVHHTCVMDAHRRICARLDAGDQRVRDLLSKVVAELQKPSVWNGLPVPDFRYT